MISEVANALFLTYLASEYLIAPDHPSAVRNGRPSLPHLDGRLLYLILAGVAVVSINILDHVSGTKDMANQLLDGFLNTPKILLTATAYVVTLYLDVKRRAPLLKLRSFSSKVGWAFLKVLPAYPFLAVLISFVFLFVINIWEALQLPLEWLNAPIYFGTLYGPFAWVYVYVKRQVLQEYSSLPL